MRKMYTLLVFMTLCLVSKAQFVEVGSGNESVNQPAYTSWNYSYASMLYKSDEIGGAKKIIKISFNNNVEDLNQWGAGFELTNQKLWIKHTSDDHFEKVNASQYAYENPESDGSGYTLVWEGSYSYGALGWMEITLNTPFDYNGTDNIILHWENAHGDQKTSMKFAGTKMGDKCMVKSWGSDGAVPQTPGYMYFENTRVNARFYYEAAPGVPATPEITLPLSGAIKQDLYPEFEFKLGANTTKYDVFLGTDENNLAKVATDVPVSAIGNYKYKVTSVLDANAKYFFQIEAKNDTKSSLSPKQSFTTEEIVTTFPWTCDFEDYWTSNVDPDHPQNYNSIINTNFPDQTPWAFDQGWNALESADNVYAGNWSAKCNAYNKGEYSLRTPRLKLEGAKALKFWWRNGYILPQNSGSKAGNRGFNKNYVEITTDGGENWTELLVLTPTEKMTEYKFEFADLSAYTGDDVYIRWRCVEDADYEANNFWLDNIEISDNDGSGTIEIKEDAINFTDSYVGAELSLDIEITNIGTSNIVIDGATIAAPFSCDSKVTIEPSKTSSVIVKFKPVAAGDFSEKLVLNAGSAQGEKEVNVTGKALECLTEFFEGFDKSREIPEGWTAMESSLANHIVHNIWTVNYTSDVYSPANALKMNRINSKDTEEPVILSTPGVTNFKNNSLSFYAKKAADSYTLTLIVGTMSDPNNPKTFVALKTIDLTPDYEKYTVKFKPNTKGPHIAFKYGTYAPVDPFPFASMRIDNISWEPERPMPLCPVIVSPVDGAKDIDTYRPIELRWSAGSANTNGYKVTVGTNDEGNNIEKLLELGADKYKYTFTNDLGYSQKVTWQVIAFNEKGESENCPVNTFTTMADPEVTEYPYIVDFENTVDYSGRHDVPLGMSLEDANGNGRNWDMVTTPPAKPGLTHNNSKGALANEDFGYKAKDDWFFTAPLRLKASATYNYEFFIYTMLDLATNAVYHEEMEVWIGKDKNSAAMTTKLAYADVNDYKEWKKYTKDFTVDEDGVYYIGFHAISAPQQYVLLFDDLKITETITATDNAPKVLKDIEAIDVQTNATPVTKDLSSYFTDPDGDALTYSVESNTNTELVTTDIQGSNLTVSFIKDKSGDAVLTVKATANGKSVTAPVNVKVNGTISSIYDADLAGISLYPNPASETINITVSDSDLYNIKVYSIAGKLVYTSNEASNNTTIDVSEWERGLYLAKIEKRGQSYTIKILVK
ncbi:MAG: choice-of-anchor J domain-containing protein [Bacteroidales bacterium]|nr:choice-of-anchor J domain-containing protein [Bacteroidales bacterium]